MSHNNNLNNPIKPLKLSEIIKLNGPLPSLVLPPVVLCDTAKLKLDPWWIIGFIVGEGSFTYNTNIITTIKGIKRYSYRLIFAIAQNNRDYQVLKAINSYLVAGTVLTDKSGMSYYRVESLYEILHMLLPFFYKYQLVGHKKLQYDIWLEVILLKIYDRARDSLSLDNRSSKLFKLIERLSLLSPSQKKFN